MGYPVKIIDKTLSDEIEFTSSLSDRVDSSRFEMKTPVKNFTIDEMAEVLGFICQIQPVVFYEPFPHIHIDTYYGEITIFDSYKGWLEKQIESDKFAVRCVLSKVIGLSEVDISNFNREGCDDSRLVKDSGRLIFQSVMVIEFSDCVESILNKLINLSSRCERLFSINAMKKLHAI